MKHCCLVFCLFISFFSGAQNSRYFLEGGLDYRQEPIDIEDVPRGPIPPSNGGFYGTKFWQVFSLKVAGGVSIKNNWKFSTSGYVRHNHLNYIGGANFNYYPDKYKTTKEKKNFKYDFFINAEKSLKLKKHKEQYLFALAGLGYTNLNTKYDVVIQDTFPSGLGDKRHYKGSLAHFSPRLSLGYQYEKVRGSLDAYIIEGPDLTNLTSLWLGATVSYEITLNRKKKKS